MKQPILFNPVYWCVMIIIFAALAWIGGIESLVTIIPFLLLVISLVFFELWIKKHPNKFSPERRMAGMTSISALICLLLSILLKSFFSWNSIEGWGAIAILSTLAIRFFIKYLKISRQLKEQIRFNDSTLNF
jgi:hypothetical protein